MKKTLHISFLAMLMLFWAFPTFAQKGQVTGTIIDAKTNDPLPGATVLIKGTTIGTVTNTDGEFSLQAPSKNFTLEIKFIGYQAITREIHSGDNLNLGKIGLSPGMEELSAIEITASRSTSETPFTFSDVPKKEIQQNLGSRDIPLVLNTTPSFYSTNSGGGAGDARLAVRGFDQRNVGIMINGVPVNDVENGWVYWSNWDGLGDAASSIQVQRGISPVNLAVPSVGGTINIITDPAARAEGASIKQEVGSWNFRKTVISYNSGLLGDKFALSATLVRKTGDGFYKGTYTDAYSYYLGASYKINQNNKLEAYLMGAPQLHGQNLYMQNIARYDQNFASSLKTYDVAAFDKYREAGRDFNQNYNGVSPTYTGNQYYAMYNTFQMARHDNDFIMERENYYHKPQANINYFARLNDKLQWNTVAYWSGGAGGGSGTYGSVSTDYSYAGMGVRQWDAQIAKNSSNLDSAYTLDEAASTGILRNSVNTQNTYGTISKLFYNINSDLVVQGGIDYRYSKIDHYREVRDLLGGDYIVFTGNDFETAPGQQMKRLGDKIDYDNTNIVNWMGGYLQGEYKTNKVSIFGMGGFTTVTYDYTDHFKKDENGSAENLKSDNLPGFQVKGGFTYKFTRDFNVYVNGGYISRNPIFDYAIDDVGGTVIKDPNNEKITTAELGTSYNIGNKFAATLSLYNTLWNDRTVTRTRTLPDGTDGVIFIPGLSQLHQGVELQGSYQPAEIFRLDAGFTFANWEYQNDVNATYTTYNNGVANEDSVNLYINGLKVGNAPQNQLSLAATVKPIQSLSFKFVYRYYSKFYADFDPLTRDDITDRTQSWKIPDYGVMDLHVFYDIPLNTNDFSIQLFAHVFNVFDKVFVQDAVDNSAYNAFDNDHDADDAEVFLGLPRNYNVGIVVRF